MYKAAAPRVAGTQTVYSWTRENPSTYLFDMGLWTACKESREIILTHFNMRYWNEKKREFQQRIRNYCYLGHENGPFIANIHHDGEELYLMVNPQRDLFCLDPRNSCFTTDSDYFLCDLPFSNIWRGYKPLKHIAVEFDPSWNVDLPQDRDENWDPRPTAPPRISFDDLLEERTPRGFIAQAVQNCATKTFFKDDHSFFWLIDRGIRPTSLSWNSKFVPHEFFGDNHKYIETKLGGCDTVEEYYQTAHHFIDQFKLIASEDLDRISLGLGTDGSDDDFSFEVEDCLGVLACR
jgi:hypothetical protein